jgi:putative DNA primase/helicase
LRPGVEFARQRKRAAKRLGVSAADIDAELEARRDERILAPLYGHWIVDPWPDPVEGDSLLRDIIRRLQRHVVCSHDDSLAIGLWVMLAWVHDSVAVYSPVLNINSAQPESGKSTTLGLIAFLVPRCISSVEISEAALYRAIKLWQPSFAIDEFDTVLADDETTGLRSVINSGHTRGQGVVRCVGRDEKTPELFSTFCPKALGMCGRKMPEATLSRCIFIELKRKKGNEAVERFFHKDDTELAELRSRLARWSADNEDTLRAAVPSMPAEFSNRRADNWRVQFAIADLAGTDWGDKARDAAVAIERTSDSKTAGVRVLAAIKVCFDQTMADAIGSQDLVDTLAADTTSEWAEWRGGKPITQRQLAILLKPLRIFPDRVRIGAQQVRGYQRSWFEDAWERYLPVSPRIYPSMRQKAKSHAGFLAIFDPSRPVLVRSQVRRVRHRRSG